MLDDELPSGTAGSVPARAAAHLSAAASCSSPARSSSSTQTPPATGWNASTSAFLARTAGSMAFRIPSEIPTVHRSQSSFCQQSVELSSNFDHCLDPLRTARDGFFALLAASHVRYSVISLHVHRTELVLLHRPRAFSTTRHQPLPVATCPGALRIPAARCACISLPTAPLSWAPRA